MKLYRGDNIFNTKTTPYLYRNNGLLSKAFWGKDNPCNIERLGLLQTIYKHINPQNSIDREYYNTTDFISFSTSRKRAEYWCSDKGQLILEAAKDYEETRYLFILDIEDKYFKNLGRGIHSYSFYCNPQLKTTDSNNPFHKVASSLAYYRQEPCSVCNNKKRNHQIILINAVEYLKSYPQQMTSEKALQNATLDEEFLILPLDYVEQFRETRIPRADFWTVELYKNIKETRPELPNLI
jgi:hypothetical protein